MRVHSAVITGQGITFMIVAVPKLIIDDRGKAEQTIQFLQTRWGGLPIARVTRDERGAPAAYYGRGDLAMQLIRVPPSAMPWNDLSIP
jgi:hypothetical protein